MGDIFSRLCPGGLEFGGSLCVNFLFGGFREPSVEGIGIQRLCLQKSQERVNLLRGQDIDNRAKIGLP